MQHEMSRFDLYVYLKQFVRIKLKPGVLDQSGEDATPQRFIKGWIFTIDPISLTHAIVNFDEQDDELRTAHVTLVFNDNIERVDILGSDLDEKKIERVRQRLDELFASTKNITEQNQMNSSLSESGATREGSKSQQIDLVEARRKLIEWLQKNRLQVKLERADGSLIDNEAAVQPNSSGDVIVNILDSVYIHAPYTAESCVSTNEIILDRVRNLINNCPS